MTTAHETNLAHLEEELTAANTIEGELYEKFEVKRGLRNKDGSGVLAGLTHISSVLGFHKIEGELVPIDGILKYRGIDLEKIIEEVKTHPSHYFERVVFLLMVGRFPNNDEFEAFNKLFTENRHVHPTIVENVIKGLPSKDIMNKLQTSISALYSYDEAPDDLDPYQSFIKGIKLIAKIPMILAYSYLAAYKPNATYVEPTEEMSHAEAFLFMLNEGVIPSDQATQTMDMSLVLHAEHGGGNNSTFTTYVISSSGSDMYSTLAGAVASLKGPLHGAANRKVMEMMTDIKANVKNWTNTDEIKDYLSKIIKQEAFDKSGKIYGLGHAVYTKSDPRAVAIMGYAEAVAKASNREDELQLYKTIAEEGPKLFQVIKGSEKVIAPNVDFFSGFVYDSLELPLALYTPMFAMARCSGWMAHRIEELISGKRIIRPGYKYIP